MCGRQVTKQYATRVRQSSASTKTTNLGLAALDAKKRYFDPRSRKGASGRGPFFAAPWSGFVERPWSRRSFCFLPSH